MRIVWDERKPRGYENPTVKVDGQVIRNVTIADDVQGVVEYLKHNKIRTIRGNVEIIGN